MSKFQVYKDASGEFRFRLRAGNNQIVAVGEAYEQRAGCLNGIKSIQRNCKAAVEDLTMNERNVPNPKFQIYQNAKGEYRFRLRAANGEIIAEGEGYDSKEGCLHGIEVVRESCDAEVEDTSITRKKASPEPVTEKRTASIVAGTAESVPAIEEPAKMEVKSPETEAPPTPIPIEPKAASDESSSLEVEIEEKPKEIPTSTTTMETPESVPWSTKLELYSVPQSVGKGTVVTLKGRLVSASTGKGVPSAKVRVYERDRSILGDDYLAFGKTDEKGEFAIVWKARPLTWRKTTGNIYAVFTGDERAKAAKSDIQTISIS